MSNNIDIGPKKSMFVLVVVVGCFSILWPKVFYPMLIGNAHNQAKPNPIDRTSGCEMCMISDKDIVAVKLIKELCNTINVSDSSSKNLYNLAKQRLTYCRTEILKNCGIDIDILLKDDIQITLPVKRVLNQIRSNNGSLCLKLNFGLDTWTLGVTHETSKFYNFLESPPIRQERPAHMNPDMLHPALRERGRAIPATHTVPRVMEGRPGPIPGMRPPMGGPGHVVPPSTKGTSSMSVIMPIYTIGIVIFFTYTLMKIMFKKPVDPTHGLYPHVQANPHFRKEVFEADKNEYVNRNGKEDSSVKLGWKERDTIVNAMSALLAEVDQQREEDERLKTEHIQQQTEVIANGTPSTISNGSATPVTQEKEKKDEQPIAEEEPKDETSVKVVGLELTASCEGGQKWSRPNTPLMSSSPQPPQEPVPTPQSIYLEGALPAQSQLLVSDSATETEIVETDDEDENAVVLSGKMTLSVINLDNIDKVVNSDADFNTIDNEVQGLMNEEDLVEDSKYTTASNATAAENDISEDEGHMSDGEEEIEED